jgi:phosphoribosylaminoimidazolecarboxamide formyltransferase/IMP cyclohydrolase
MALRKVVRALLSTHDKTGVVAFARGLAALGVELISTGGTRKALAEDGLPVREVSEVTGFPEMLDGRVKTLHPKIHAGILSIRDNPQHQAAMQEHKLSNIDLVVVNLYPFERTVARSGASDDEIIENIDVGGPAMIRAAAKNFHDVAVVTNPADYEPVLLELREQGGTTLATRQSLAAAAFARTAAYDAAIAAYFAGRQTEPLPESLRLRFNRRQMLRYGENPHQHAAWYVEPQAHHACVATAEVLGGKELSYNNLLDLDSALNLVREFAEPAAVVLKHNNPCGAAVGQTLEQAFERAYEGDPLSAFGGILGFNREVDEATAMRVTEPGRFIECIIAPDYSAKARDILTTRPKWGGNVRLLRTGPLSAGAKLLDYRRIDGGLLVQNRDVPADDFPAAKVVTKREPTPQQRADLEFAWKVCKHVKSNAIVLAKDGQVVGVGAGQMSRVDSVHLAACKAGERAKGSVLASDAFFPFPDNVHEAAKSGVTAIVQPGGSVKDKDSIAAADEHGLAMLFTGVRHFRH